VFSSNVIEIERDGHIGRLWLNRPDKLNAFNEEMWTDLPPAVETLVADGVRTIVLGARGRVFTAGIDLEALATFPKSADVASRRALYAEIKRLQASISAVADAPVPVIAAVHGACIGAGIDLIAACDIRLASSDASFSVRETRMAMVADVGTLQRLPTILNAGHLAELVYTGVDIDAAEAERIGLVNHVYDDANALLDGANEIAERIVANSPLAVQGAKAVLRAGTGRPVGEALDYVALWNAAFLHSEDLGEAIAAFFEKRSPDFKGA
jgi:enoyl-CoA hydratase